MAKSRKKKTTSQQVMGMAALTMPAPVRDVVTTRWGSRLALLLGAGLLATGVVSLNWSDGKPHVQFNKERAAEIRHEIEEFEGQHQQEKERLTERFGFGKKSQ